MKTVNKINGTNVFVLMFVRLLMQICNNRCMGENGEKVCRFRNRRIQMRKDWYLLII